MTRATSQTLSVSFTPTDTTDYTTATATATINVDKAAPSITWANPAGITYGTALTSHPARCHRLRTRHLHLHAGRGHGLERGHGSNPLGLASRPTDTTDYTTASATATINVDKATPTITWANPADITYGTALSTTQLDATASVPGTLTYTPVAGTVLNAGAGQTLSVSFTPTDSDRLHDGLRHGDDQCR